MVPDSYELLNEGDIVRLTRFPDQAQTHLVRQVMPFLVIAFRAGADQVLPGILAAVDLGNDMIDGHGSLFAAAILAAAPVALEDVLAS